MSLLRNRYFSWLIKGGLLFIISILCFYLVYYLNQETLNLAEQRELKGIDSLVELSNGSTYFSYQMPQSDTLPTLIFIHGGGVAGSYVWEKNLPYFSKLGYGILSYDLYGRGFSDRPDIDYTPEELYLQLNELIEKLEIKEPVHLVALSLGSMPALEFASKNPEKVKSITMISPVISGEFVPSLFMKLPLVSDLLMTLYWYPRAVDNQAKEFVDPQIFSEYKVALDYFSKIKGYKEVNKKTWLNTLVRDYRPFLSSVSGSDISTMIIYGKADPYLSKGTVENLINLGSGIELQEIDNVGHLPQYEKPNVVNQIVQSVIVASERNGKEITP